jgi:TAG lipase/steryl ester hydrolase/phospholipase A2/LPA acyltransferase
MDSTKLQHWLRNNFGDTTFKEAYQKTGRVLNIAVSSTENYEIPRLLNYLTAPNVLIWSAVIASCALPFVFQPVELLVTI